MQKLAWKEHLYLYVVLWHGAQRRLLLDLSAARDIAVEDLGLACWGLPQQFILQLNDKLVVSVHGSIGIASDVRCIVESRDIFDPEYPRTSFWRFELGHGWLAEQHQAGA